MSELIDQVLEANAAHAAGLDPDAIAKQPTRRVAIVTDDVERSILLSQYALGTRTVILAGHTDCGLLGHDEEATNRIVETERGRRPTWPLYSIADAESGVRDGLRRLTQSPWLHHVEDVHGFVYDVATGRLTHVVPQD